MCKELYALSETVTIEISTTYLKFKVEGEVGNGEIMIKTDPNADISDKRVDDEAIALSFALRYLNMFNKANVLSNQVKIMMTPENPLVVVYEVDKLGELKFYLAPKINDM